MRLQLSESPQILTDGGEPLPLALRDAALLAWLAIEGPTSRERLGTLLWPDSSTKQARTTLRQRLFKLRQALGRDVVDGSPVAALAADVSHDLAGAPDILGDEDLAEAPEFNAWLHEQRERRRAGESEAMRAQAQAMEADGDAAAALPVAQALLRLEPLSEDAHRRVMRLHYLNGDRAAALLAFDACERVLKDEVGTRPSAQTLALLATLEQASVATGAAAPTQRPIPPAVQRPPRMVGRAREAQALQHAWGAGHAVMLTGDAGMGKSRLLAEVAALQGGLASAAGRPGDAGVPYATLARLLRAVGEFGARDAEAIDLAQVLAEPSPAAWPGQRQAFEQALGRHLCATPGLVGITLDDLHFADPASLETLQALITDTPARALHWALACRPVEAHGALYELQAALTDTVHLEAIVLEPLDEAALAELVDQLPLGVAGAALAPRLRQRTGGNPLFVLETLKQAWIAGALEPGQAELAWPRPASVERLIDRRVSQLSAGALALARVASIAGEDFDIALAEQVLGTPSLQLADAATELEQAQILRGTQFAHDLVFDAVLRTVPQVIATHTHAKVAAWLEQHHGEPARIARHWIDGAQPALALPWLDSAAQRAQRALRLKERLEFLELKAGIEEALGRKADAFRTLLSATSAHLDTDRGGLEGYERCARLELLASTAQEHIDTALARSALAARRRDFDIAEDAARDALDRALALGDAKAIVDGRTALLEALTVQDRTSEALEQAQACLDWIDSQAPMRQRGNFHGLLGMIYDNAGQPALALPHHEQALAAADATGNRLERAIISNNLGCSHINTGRLREATRWFADGLQIHREHDGGDADMAPLLLNLAECLCQGGRYREALSHADDAALLAGRCMPTAVPIAWAHQAACWWQLGQRAHALKALDRIDSATDAALSARVRGHRLRFMLKNWRGERSATDLDVALALLPDGQRPDLREMLLIERSRTLDPMAALDSLDAVRERAHCLELGGHELEAHVRSAEVAAAVDPQRARDHALKAVELAQRLDLVFSYPGDLWLYCAQALFIAGDKAAGTQLLQRGLAWLRNTMHNAVAEEWRASFLHRNPINVQLAALAAAHGIAAPP